MAARSHKPIEGSPTLPGFQTRPGLIHMLTPEFTGLDPADFEDITPEHIALAAASKLRPSLINVPRGTSSVSFLPITSNYPMRIALSAVEYNAVVRNADALGNDTYNETKGNYSPEGQLTDEVKGRARRAGVHAAESRLRVMGEHLAVVQRRLRIIDSFKERSRHPNLQRTGLAKSREDFDELRAHVIGGIVLAVDNQRGWTEAQAKLAERSIVAGLYILPRPSQRVRNFRDFMGLAREYYGYEEEMLQGRVADVNNYIRDNITPDYVSHLR